MANTKHNRSEVVNFYELTEKQQQDVLDCYFQDQSEAEQTRFVIFEAGNPEYNAALPLNMFMRTNKPNIWDGIFGTSYFSAYFVKLSKCGTMAVVAEKFI